MADAYSTNAYGIRILKINQLWHMQLWEKYDIQSRSRYLSPPDNLEAYFHAFPALFKDHHFIYRTSWSI